MRRLKLRLLNIRVLGLSLLLMVAVVVGVTELEAQSKRSKTTKKSTGPSATQLRQLELKEQKAKEEFLRQQVDLAKEYESAGLLEKAKALLQTVQRVEPKVPGLKEKLDELEESILSENPNEIELDVSKGWGDPLARVEKGKRFRIQAEGSYRFSVEGEIDANGFANSDPIREMAKDVPTGALMAVIIPITDKGKPGKPGTPITVGESKEITPSESGLLFLAINAPQGHKSSGKLDIKLSGYVTTASGN
ncbi:hypothetical protein GC176_28170 [bacterium]|nr:hypothetical protein [bacterium]